jgi:hypothetical protein
MKIRTVLLRMWKQRDTVAASSWIAMPVCVILTAGIVFRLYLVQNDSGQGEPFAWCDGASAWPSIAMIVFAALLSVHFIFKTCFDLRQNAGKLTQEFGLKDTERETGTLLGWETPPLKQVVTSSSSGVEATAEEKVDIEALWQHYLRRGQLWMRILRSAPMTGFYICALISILPLIGDFPAPPIRGSSSFFPVLMFATVIVFLLLTFFVIDAILLHEGFLKQLTEKKTYWPDATFEKHKYSVNPRPDNENDLADYWDILLIAKRTEAVGNKIYYPFVILLFLIVARLKYFDNWTWTPALIVALSLHFSLALYAAWRLPVVAREYRDRVVGRLKRRKRQALMAAQRIPEVSDTMIEDVQSTHQGAFSYLWDQPAIRALLLPSGGIGLATLLQYLPR